jgi:hypothetical protein
MINFIYNRSIRLTKRVYHPYLRKEFIYLPDVITAKRKIRFIFIKPMNRLTN